MAKNSKNDRTTPDNFVNRIKNYSIRIEERLYKRINKHIQLLKHLNSSQSQKNWIEKAILEKFEREEERNITECIPPEKHLSFKTNSQIHATIEKKVEVIRKFRSSFSKKQWILEAIQEKLDREEEKIEKQTKELLENMINSSSTFMKN
jgi:hypothetical protein